MQDLQLENLKVGDEVVSIIPKNGKFTYGGICIVKEWDEKFNRWRYVSSSNPEKNLGAFPKDGGQRYFMSKNPNPDYYFSANPKHLKAARQQHKRAQIRREKKEAQENARFEEFQVKFNALMKEYGASIHAFQTRGDDQGVEVAAEVCMGNHSIRFED